MSAKHKDPWSVNEQTPNTIITPHGRISVSWSGQAADTLAEKTAAEIVQAMNSHAELVDALETLVLEATEHAQSMHKVYDRSTKSYLWNDRVWQKADPHRWGQVQAARTALRKARASAPISRGGSSGQA